MDGFILTSFKLSENFRVGVLLVRLKDNKKVGLWLMGFCWRWGYFAVFLVRFCSVQKIFFGSCYQLTHEFRVFGNQQNRDLLKTLLSFFYNTFRKIIFFQLRKDAIVAFLQKTTEHHFFNFRLLFHIIQCHFILFAHSTIYTKA